MRVRDFTSSATMALVAVAVVLLPSDPAAGQAPARDTAKARASAGKALRTPWGDPDLQGVWTNTTTTPFERPAAHGDKAVLSEEERIELDEQAVRNADRAPKSGDPGTYNDFWFDRGRRSDRTSLIIDPPDGRLPALTPQAKELQAEISKARRGAPTTWEDVSLYERCITRSLPGAMLPGFYNHNYHILQSPGYVAIVVEMIHDVRIIPTDGRPHLGRTINSWLGDSRGRWEGNTLVVETTNIRPGRELRPSRTVMGGTEQLKVVERFTRVDADTVDYQFTVTDPWMFTRPWTVSTPMAKADIPIYEYACHEGNYAIVNMLSGARKAEREAAQGKR
jgi:hypothetical protein